MLLVTPPTTLPSLPMTMPLSFVNRRPLHGG
jgi:hypothetical protein